MSNKNRPTADLLDDKNYYLSKIDLHRYPTNYNKAIQDKIHAIDEVLESRDGENFHTGRKD